MVIARADDFPDALAGNYLAGQLGAPILLSHRDDVPNAVAGEIARLGASKAHVLGGAAAIGQEVVAELEAAGLAVSRVFGADRFDTAASIASTSPATGVGLDNSGRRTAIVGTGAGFADLLAAGSLSYVAKFPVLVTVGSSLSAPVSDVLTDLGVKHVLLLGGPAAVSPAVEADLVDLGVVVTRLGGANRFETAVAVARFALAQKLVTADHVDVATGTAFPDALAMGPLAGTETATTVLVGARPVPALCTLLSELPIVAGHVVGGPNAVSDTAKAAIEACVGATTSDEPSGGSGGGGGGGGGDSTTPLTPDGLVASGADASVTLTWNAVPGDGVRYHILQASRSDGPYLPRTSSPVSETVYIADSLPNDEIVWFKVYAVTEAGDESPPSLPVSAVPSAGLTSIFLDEGDITPTQGAEDKNDYELGVSFVAEKNVSLLGVRIYNRGLATVAGRDVKLWSENGEYSDTALATWDIDDQLSPGWQDITFDVPFSLAQGEWYVLAYDVGDGSNDDLSYVSNAHSSGLSNGVLTYPFNAGRYSASPDVYPEIDNRNNYGIEPMHDDAEADAPVVEIWGASSQAQGKGEGEVYNILGHAHSLTTRLTVTVDGGTPETYAIGRGSRRLAGAGDFVIDLDKSEVTGATVIEVEASGAAIVTTTDTVTLSPASPATLAPGTYTWNGSEDPFGADGDLSPIDGRWRPLGAGNGFRAPAVMGYDRMLQLAGGVGQYTFTGTVTVNKFDIAGLADNSISGSSMGIAVINHWQGHNATQFAMSNPREGFAPGLGGMLWLQEINATATAANYKALKDSGGTGVASTATRFYDVGESFKFKITVSDDGTNPTYQTKVWDAADIEPEPWTFEFTDGNTNLSGGLVLVAHHVDVTWSDLQLVIPPAVSV